MKIDPNSGEEWAYRRRDDAASERVLVRALHRQGQKFRADIRHLSGDKVGLEENVPRGRLHVPWDEVGDYDALMEGLGRLRAEALTKAEESALWKATALLLPPEVAELFASPVDEALLIHDQPRFEPLIGQSLSVLQHEFAWILYDGKTCLSPRGSLRVAELLCRKNPAPVLEVVMAEEAEAREKSKHGGTVTSFESNELLPTSPDLEYKFYLERHKPVHEILRHWCGYQAVTDHERLLAAEGEIHRLDTLLASALTSLRHVNKHQADTLADEHENERITPYAIRPIPERPLQPHEIPVIRIPARRQWWR
ncbi:hypothetical protein [Arthrobacter sp. AQ5-05]|uniref:hypothetical protein n=1 Tax=Arthrobacter sp. AQ5-05 TaxID=2184581 RepID=UPI0011BDD8C4|nr:hypothetical protein [Arthrobacter sp. AQ5-05]